VSFEALYAQRQSQAAGEQPAGEQPKIEVAR
jgi:hypothetical protein